MEPPKKLRYRDLLRNLICEKNVLIKLFGDNQRYSKLLQELEKYDMNDDEPFPNQKVLLDSLGMSRTKLMNFMEGLYHGFHTRLFNPNAYPITDTEIWLFVNTRDDYWPMGINSLQFLPGKGDDFSVEFIGGLWDASYLTVESVTHEIENGIHKVNIHLENPPLE